jgi:hypothetical protein
MKHVKHWLVPFNPFVAFVTKDGRVGRAEEGK